MSLLSVGHEHAAAINAVSTVLQPCMSAYAPAVSRLRIGWRSTALDG